MLKISFLLILLISSSMVMGVGPIAMTVQSLERSIPFYRDVLNFNIVSETTLEGTEFDHLVGIFNAKAKIVTMALGDEEIQLVEFLNPQGRPIPQTEKSNDQWFQHIAIIVSNMEEAFEHLKAHNITYVSPSPQTLPKWNQKAAGIKAFYFKDPDGHTLEILYYPKDKGRVKWHEKTDKLFLGIDHTAIVVNDTDKSIQFFEQFFNMRVAGGSLNYGIEQEKLNNVFNARVRITLLADNQGPTIELLEYITPRDGERTPRDEKLNDIWSWFVHIDVDDLQELEERLFQGHETFISGGIQKIKNKTMGFKQGLMIRDPDSHAFLLRQK